MMEFIIQNVSFTLLIAIFFLIATYTIKWVLKKRSLLKYYRSLGYVGPEPSLVFGNLKEFSENPIDSTSRWLSKYGKIVLYFLGDRPMIIVKDLEILKYVFIKNFSNFKDRPDMAIDVKPIAYGLAAINGPRWKETRSILSPTFSSKKLKLMSNLMEQSVSTLLELIKEKADANKSFDIYAMSQGLTMDVIGKCALALNVNCQKDPEDELLVASRDFMRFSVNPVVQLALVYPPLAKVLEYINNYLTAGKMTTLIVNNLKKVISFRRKNQQKKFVDMLQLMLNAEDCSNEVRSSAKSLTDNEIMGNAMTFVVAGFETTANNLGYTFYLLAKHQEIQDKLRDELRNSHIDYEDSNAYSEVNALVYLDQVLNESLRLYPPVVTFVNRKAAATITINGLVIPKGTDVQAPVYQIHHDPEIWPDPEKFDPSRFCPENKEKIHTMAFLPFGAGPRNCVGMRFAVMESKLAIARVIKNFRIVFCDETEDPLQITVPTVTANPVNGIVLKAQSIQD